MKLMFQSFPSLLRQTSAKRRNKAKIIQHQRSKLGLKILSSFKNCSICKQCNAWRKKRWSMTLRAKASMKKILKQDIGVKKQYSLAKNNMITHVSLLKKKLCLMFISFDKQRAFIYSSDPCCTFSLLLGLFLFTLFAKFTSFQQKSIS